MSEYHVMQQLDVERTNKILNTIMEYELGGVVRYTHYALMVSGPNRIPIVDFMKAQASESLVHAQQAGELLTGLGGHPTLTVAPVSESFEHSTQSLLAESLNHELRAISLYGELLEAVADQSVYLEEYARQMISAEEQHCMELRKMLRDVQQ